MAIERLRIYMKNNSVITFSRRTKILIRQRKWVLKDCQMGCYRLKMVAKEHRLFATSLLVYKGTKNYVFQDAVKTTGLI